MNQQIPFVSFLPHERDFFIRRIMSGRFNFEHDGREYTFIHPNNRISTEGSFVFYDTYKKLKDSCPTDSMILDILVSEYGWCYEDESFLSNYDEKVKDIKCEMFKNIYNGPRRLQLKNELTNLDNKYKEKYAIRHSLDHYTSIGVAQEAKWMYYLENCLYSKKKKVVLPDAQLKAIMGSIFNHFLTEPQYRDLAKHEPWQSIWFVGRGRNIFNRKVMDYTDEQMKICSLSQMYENIRKSHKPPSEDVIFDDDLLDGWIFLNNMEREQERNINNMDARLGKKVRDSQEVFIPVRTVEEAKKINSLNTQNDKMLKQKFIDGVKK